MKIEQIGTVLIAMLLLVIIVLLIGIYQSITSAAKRAHEPETNNGIPTKRDSPQQAGSNSNMLTNKDFKPFIDLFISSLIQNSAITEFLSDSKDSKGFLQKLVNNQSTNSSMRNEQTNNNASIIDDYINKYFDDINNAVQSIKTAIVTHNKNSGNNDTLDTSKLDTLNTQLRELLGKYISIISGDKAKAAQALAKEDRVKPEAEQAKVTEVEEKELMARNKEKAFVTSLKSYVSSFKPYADDFKSYANDYQYIQAETDSTPDTEAKAGDVHDIQLAAANDVPETQVAEQYTQSEAAGVKAFLDDIKNFPQVLPFLHTVKNLIDYLNENKNKVDGSIYIASGIKALYEKELLNNAWRRQIEKDNKVDIKSSWQFLMQPLLKSSLLFETYWQEKEPELTRLTYQCKVSIQLLLALDNKKLHEFKLLTTDADNDKEASVVLTDDMKKDPDVREKVEPLSKVSKVYCDVAAWGYDDISGKEFKTEQVTELDIMTPNSHWPPKPTRNHTENE